MRLPRSESIKNDEFQKFSFFLKITKIGLWGSLPDGKKSKTSFWLKLARGGFIVHDFFWLESSERAGSDDEGPESSFLLEKPRILNI